MYGQRGGNMKIELEVSEDNEATDSPYWLILEPQQNMILSINMLAGQITGPFFSRKSAQNFLDRTRYNFTSRALVYCCSGYNSQQYKEAIREGLLKCSTQK